MSCRRRASATKRNELPRPAASARSAGWSPVIPVTCDVAQADRGPEREGSQDRQLRRCVMALDIGGRVPLGTPPGPRLGQGPGQSEAGPRLVRNLSNAE